MLLVYKLLRLSILIVFIAVLVFEIAYNLLDMDICNGYVAYMLYGCLYAIFAGVLLLYLEVDLIANGEIK